MKKTQVFLIHGGYTFNSYKDYLHFLKTRKIRLNKKITWSDDYLIKKLGDGFEVIKPRMPLSDNAKYNEWKIYFERFFPFLKNNFILIGGSLGGIFLAKYLSEHKIPKKIRSLYLIAPPFDGSLSEETLAGGFKLKSDLSLIKKNCKNINLLFSSDDEVIPISHATKYARKLKSAKITIFDNVNGHFQISKFPEIIKMIKRDVIKK